MRLSESVLFTVSEDQLSSGSFSLGPSFSVAVTIAQRAQSLYLFGPI